MTTGLLSLTSQMSAEIRIHHRTDKWCGTKPQSKIFLWVGLAQKWKMPLKMFAQA